MKKVIYIFLGMVFFCGVINVDLSSNLSAYANTTKYTKEAKKDILLVKALDVVNSPQRYLNKTIVMDVNFDKFSTLGLDYKPVMRNSQDFIGILIKRDDVVDHIVPLSEMKIFLKRDLAEKNIDLETEDRIRLTGKVFSVVLGDPWIDVSAIEVLQKAKNK